MTNTLSGYVLRLTTTVDLTTETCFTCHVVFAMQTEQRDKLIRKPRTPFYCPNGHQQWYTGKSDERKLEEAEARELALKDQLSAAIREGDSARSELLRTRQRIANGVCVCCNRTFPNVLAHMASKHPDFALPANVKHAAAKAVVFRCSCGSSFKTYQGLRVHQGSQRGDGWDAPDTSRWTSHLSVV